MKIAASALLCAALFTIASTPGFAAPQASAKAHGSTNADSNRVQADSQSSQAAGQLQSGSTVQAELTKTVDVRKNKSGDEVVAKTTKDLKSNGQVVLPKGSKIVGHITHTQARLRNQEESQLAIAFDHAILKNGTTVPAEFQIQAIASAASESAMPPTEEAMAMDGGAMQGASAGAVGGGRPLSGIAAVSGNAGVMNTMQTATSGTVSAVDRTGLNTTAGLNSASHGVSGIPGLTLTSVAANSTGSSSIIRSSSSNIRLDSGTRMVLAVSNQALQQ